MSVLIRRFGCPICKTPFTSWLQELPGFLAGGEDRCTQSATGCWSRREESRHQDAPIAVLISEAQNLVPHEDTSRSTGCCGVGFRDKLPNLRCATCKAEVAYRESDGNHIWHSVYLPEYELESSTRDSPDDQKLLARLEAHRQNREELPKALSWDEMLSKLMPAPISDYDTERMPRIAPLKSFEVRVGRGGELRMILNGSPIRVLWPRTERERAITLGRMPEGRPDEPVYWWVSEASTDAQGQTLYWQHEWSFWRDHDDIFVVWRWLRRIPNDPVLLFRVDAAYWNDAWESSTIPGI